jgi:3',5'-cyclic-AMP phosphodiesterase
MRPIHHFAAALIAGALPLAGHTAVGAQEGPSPPAATAEPLQPVRFFFVTDVHSRHARMEHIVGEVNRTRPDLVLDGGDMVHDATESEWRRALELRGRLEVPWYVAVGNHDADLTGPFASPPPAVPTVQVVEYHGLRFILLDNHDERISAEQFRLLEEELQTHAGTRTVVAMHVPAFVERAPFVVRFAARLPVRFASPVMRDSAEVARFTTLMERHGVLAVFAGHTHFHDDASRGGVRYVVSGAVGGLTPGLGIPHEYLDVTVTGREVAVRRVQLGAPTRNPVRFLARAFRYYAELHAFNHAEQGWNYVPSAGVQFRTGLRQTTRGPEESVAAWGAAAFERGLDPSAGRRAIFADAGLSAGRREVALHLSGGYKVRPVGGFNQNVFLSGAATANAGVLAAQPTAGVGAQLGLGFEWRGLTAEASRNWATNHRGTMLAVGHRF